MNTKKAKKIHYEEALVNIADKKSLYVEKVEELIWTEIDTSKHYKRAIDIIYPSIQKKENE